MSAVMKGKKACVLQQVRSSLIDGGMLALMQFIA